MTTRSPSLWSSCNPIIRLDPESTKKLRKNIKIESNDGSINNREHKKIKIFRHGFRTIKVYSNDFFPNMRNKFSLYCGLLQQQRRTRTPRVLAVAHNVVQLLTVPTLTFAESFIGIKLHARKGFTVVTHGMLPVTIIRVAVSVWIMIGADACEIV